MITDEMKRKALDAYMRNDVSVSEDNLYAALEAVAPMVRNAALEDAKAVAKSHGDTWSGSRDVEVCVQEAAVDRKVDDIVADIEALKSKVTP